MATEMRLDELARRAGVATTTVRLYRTRGLLPPPRLEGRTGWYGPTHLARLQLVGRLQEQGFSLAGIAALLDQWERGRSLDAVIGVEAELAALLGGAHAVDVDPAELLAHFPPGALTPELMARAIALGLVAPTEDGTVRVTDRRFLDTGAALAHLGVPLAVVLDEWQALLAHTDEVAGRFLGLFEAHLAPPDWRDGLDSEGAEDLARTLAQLQATARQVLAAALDASVARLARDRLGTLLDPS